MKPLDIENIMRIEVQKETDAACMASPISQDLAAPAVVFIRTGGATSSIVADEHNVMIHCYAGSWADAVDLGNTIAGICKALPYRDNAVNGLSIGTLPYNNFDPQHPTIPRVSFSVNISARSERN